MIAILLGTHGKFSEEILKSAEMILGKQKNIATITFLPGEDADDLKRKYVDTLKTLQCEDGMLVLVDLFGGSPFNVANRMIYNKKNMDIITGINIPMLLEVILAREKSNVYELAQIAISTGQLGIKSLKETLKKRKENLENTGDIDE